jgi:hypothetical protein
VVERRKKNRSGNNKGKAACKKNARPRKRRPERREPAPQDSQPLENGGAAGPAPEEAPRIADLSSESLRVALPGELYQRSGQWWWRVKLPGEDRIKARLLLPEAGNGLIVDRETAEKAAVEMWEHTVGENAARQAKIESAEKIERLKAQFLDKVRHFTELVETANAKIEAETKARAEAEAKLARLAQAGAKMEDIEPPAQSASCNDQEPPSQAPAVSAAAPSDFSGKPETETETGTCECCGAMGIAVACLTRIDSGQALCPRCLAALHADVARVDSDTPD